MWFQLRVMLCYWARLVSAFIISQRRWPHAIDLIPALTLRYHRIIVFLSLPTALHLIPLAPYKSMMSLVTL